MAGHSIESFTREVLIGNLGDMVNKHGLLYLSLINIAAGIEFLGACEDSHPFDTSGKSGERFRLGVSTFLGPIDSRYLTYNVKDDAQELYKFFRCGLLHIMVPKGGVFGVTGRASAQKANRKHLDFIPEINKVLIVVEDLYDDFKKACENMIAALPSKTGTKYSDEYLPVQDLPSLPTSGTAVQGALSGTN